MEVVDDTVFTTTVELNSENVVTSISNSFVDENLDSHVETIQYSSDPFQPVKRQKVIATEDAGSSQGCFEATASCSSHSSLQRGLVEAAKFLQKSVKPSTRTQYDRIYRIWRDFCAENDLPELEAGHEAVAACLSLVMKEGSLSKVSMLAAAIANEHFFSQSYF